MRPMCARTRIVETRRSSLNGLRSPAPGVRTTTWTQRLPRWWVVVFVGIMVTGCTSTRPTIKIGLLAPFEGVHRPLGYDVLYAVQLAIQERNAQGGVGGYDVELVALNDDGQPANAVRQVQALSTDPGVLGALGPWQTTTAQATAPVFADAGLPAVVPAALPDDVLQASPGVYRLYAGDDALAQTLAPAMPTGSAWTFDGDAAGWAAALERAVPGRETGTPVVVLTGDGESIARALTDARCRENGVICLAGPAAQEPVVAARAGSALTELTWVSSTPVVDCRHDLASFCAGYTALAGRPPGAYAILAYDATNVLLDAVAQAASTQPPQRQAVAAALAGVHRTGLNGTLAFDTARSWAQAPTVLHRGVDDSLVP